LTTGSGLSVTGVVLVGIVLLAAVVRRFLTPYAPEAIALLQRFRPPSPSHLFGTDDYGRDLFSRVLAGAAISIQVAAIVISLSVAVGTFLGAIAGLIGGWVDEAIMRLTDLFLAFPALILAAAIAATWGGSLTTTVAAL